jgi:DNA (cytosine-5)-methyltransferase 1
METGPLASIPAMATLLAPDDSKSGKRKQAPLVGTTVSLFSGAGGLDLGLESSRWDLLAQVEMDPDCAGTLARQNDGRAREVRLCAEPIECVKPAALRKNLGLKRGDLTLLAGGPPCQPFTTSGLRRALSDHRASSLFPAYLSFVRELRPAALLIENVDGMLSAALRHRPLVDRGRGRTPLAFEEMKGSFLHWFVGELTSLGYSVSWGVVEAADHGTPQLRQRAIVLAVRGAEPCFLPPPSFGRDGLPPYRTLRDALIQVDEIGPVQPLSERKREVYRHVPPGGNWRNLSEDMQRATMGAAYHAEGGKGGWWRRLSWDAPSPTILGMPDHSSTALVHPEETRCLSVNECAAVQTFPRGTEFAGSPRSQYQQIGNAVPSILARRLGEHIGAFLAGERLPDPEPPVWLRASANRRIGTHGWAIPRKGTFDVTLRSIRPDHVWHVRQDGTDGARQEDRRRERARGERPGSRTRA